ncbi:ScbA/BarX family gamma-butyrolactone biosynthesis protein [Kitasatospora sp. NPDC059973]|uniref:ScbA/BarX family gamma-butyrolactone biosynthesis protein n=1 Tax=Kitasatospora sp. NPDC059973 TaxID=3347020 RepID=UPI0036A1D34C
MYRTDHGSTMTAATTVPKELVHKRAAEEVLLTGWETTGPDAYRVTARWPRDRADSGLYDPMLLVETVRQSFPLLSHAAFDVPLGHHLVWDRFSFALVPELLLADRPAERDGDEVQLDVVCQDVVRRGNRVCALTLSYMVSRAGEPLATAQTRFTVQAPAIYRRLRGDHADAATAMARAVPPGPPIRTARPDATTSQDVALSATEHARRWQLRVDTSHPVYFDHPVDHAPGALLLDACRQAAQALCSPAPVLAVAMECVFTSYVELDEPCLVEAARLARDPAGRDRIGVTLHQGPDGATSCSTVVTVVPHPDAPTH